MTTLDVSEYKKQWAPGFLVKVTSDLDLKAKEWCRKNLKRQEWSADITADNEHSFRFEHKHHAKSFKTYFGI